MAKENVTVLALNCTLKSSKADQKSSTEKLLTECLETFQKEDVQGEILRLADYNVPAGVLSDEGDGDQWPSIRQKIMECDILLLGTPIWVGQPSSLVKRAMERMDAFYDETDAEGRMPSYGKVCALAVVGNEDGAHNVAGSVFQGLNDLGFTLPASGMTYWVGEAMSDSEYKNLRKTPKAVEQATTTMVKNAVHLARLLQIAHYPA